MSAFTTDGIENRMRWDRQSAGFLEVWYATLNHSPSGAGLWLRYTISAPKRGDPYCELWGFYFDPAGERSFAGKQRHQIDQLGGTDGRDDGALVRIGNAWLSKSHLEGEITRNGRSLQWSLDFEPAPRCFQHIPAKLRRRVEQRVSTVCSPNLSVPFTGTVKLDSDVLEVDGDLGCQSHRWGRKHSLSWAWAHCSGFQEAPDAIFEGVAARASLGPIPAPTTSLLYLSYRGEDLIFNDIRPMLTARSHYEMPSWAFTARNDRWKIVGAGRAQIDRMFQVAYTDPDGSARYCANSEIASMAVEVYTRTDSGWRHDQSLTAIGTAHLEFGRRDPFLELPVSF